MPKALKKCLRHFLYSRESGRRCKPLPSLSSGSREELWWGIGGEAPGEFLVLSV